MMTPVLDAVGEALPLAIGIAISPLAIVAVVLMLLSTRRVATSLGFTLGFVLSIGAVATIAFLLASALPHESDGSTTSAPWVFLVLGIVSIVLAVRSWRSRPDSDDDVDPPGWMQRVDSMSAVSAFGLGAFFGGIKPKNLLLSIGIGVNIEATAATGSDVAFALAIAVVIASSSVVVPVIVSLIAGDRMTGLLDRVREVMVRHNAAMVGAILLLIGVLLIGNALSGFGR